MMNTKSIEKVSSSMAYLTFIIISFCCLLLLASPITSPEIFIILTYTSLIIWIILSKHYGVRFILTFIRTELTSIPKNYLIYVSIKRFFANLTYPFYFHCFRFSFIRSGLSCGKFRTALIRTKSRLSISPLLKFFFTPFASKYTFLGHSSLRFRLLRILKRATTRRIVLSVVHDTTLAQKNYNVLYHYMMEKNLQYDKHSG